MFGFLRKYINYFGLKIKINYLSKILTALFILFSSSFFTSFEAQTLNKKDNLKGIEVLSENFSMKIEESFMVFNKNVVISYIGLDAKCDKATVILDKKTGKVQKVIMEGNVKIQKNNSTFNGEKVTLEIQNGKISIDGNVKAKMELE